MTTIEKIETSIKFLNDKTLKIYKKNRELIARIIEAKTDHKHHQFYIDYLFGFLKKKPKALKEDIEYAVDLAIFYRSKPERFDFVGLRFRDLKPKDIGERYEQIAQVMREDLKTQAKSEIQRAKQRGELIEGVETIIKYKDETYTIYLVPKLNKGYTPEQLDIQHLIYCHLGKDTDWCTANPDGTYYEPYVTHDVYVIHKNNKPYLQFNIPKTKIDQMMDVHDNEVDVLNKDLIEIIENLFT